MDVDRLFKETRTENVLDEIRAELQRQDEKWGEQNCPMLNIPFTEKGMEEKSKAYKVINDNSDNSKNCLIKKPNINQTKRQHT